MTDTLPTGTAAAPVPVHVRPLLPEDVPTVLEFVRTQQPGFEGAVQRVLEAPWSRGAPDHGTLVEAGGRVVGYLTAMYADREIEGRQERVCALGSWFVLPSFRHRSLALLHRAVAKPGLTFVTHTPNPISVTVLSRFRFETLDDGFVLLPPLVHIPTLLRPGVRVVTDRQRIYDRLSAAERRISDDHAAYGCGEVLLTQGDRYAYVVSKRRTLRNLPVSEILHISDPALVRQHLERAKLALMWVDRTLGVTADVRLLGGPPPRGVYRARRRLYRSDTLRRDAIDNLYSEIVVL